MHLFTRITNFPYLQLVAYSKQLLFRDMPEVTYVLHDKYNFYTT